MEQQENMSKNYKGIKTSLWCFNKSKTADFDAELYQYQVVAKNNGIPAEQGVQPKNSPVKEQKKVLEDSYEYQPPPEKKKLGTSPIHSRIRTLRSCSKYKEPDTDGQSPPKSSDETLKEAQQIQAEKIGVNGLSGLWCTKSHDSADEDRQPTGEHRLPQDFTEKRAEPQGEKVPDCHGREPKAYRLPEKYYVEGLRGGEEHIQGNRNERRTQKRCTLPMLVKEDSQDNEIEFSRQELRGELLENPSIQVQNTDEGQICIVYNRFGSNPVEIMHIQQQKEIPSPLAADHVIIRVQASTVSINDCVLRRGFSFDPFDPLRLPVIPGYDVVGTIASCGHAVKEFEVGDRVAALVRKGGNARYISVSASSLVSVPLSVDAAEAACMVSVYTTAYQSLKFVAKKGPMSSLEGLDILVIGGMDGVAQALIQMCKKAKSRVYVTAPKRRHSYIREVLGAMPLPNNSQEWAPIVQNKMDVVFDGLCEDGLDLPRKALNQNGDLVCFGQASILNQEMGIFGAPMETHLNKLQSKFISEVHTLDIWDSFNSDPKTFKRNLKSLFELLKLGKLKPNVARRVDLSMIPSAHVKLEKDHVRGTVVCLPWKRYIHC